MKADGRRASVSSVVPARGPSSVRRPRKRSVPGSGAGHVLRAAPRSPWGVTGGHGHDLLVAVLVQHLGLHWDDLGEELVLDRCARIYTSNAIHEGGRVGA